MTDLIAAVTVSFGAAFVFVGAVAEATAVGRVTVVGVAAGAAVARGAVVGAGAVVATGVDVATTGADSVGVVTADWDGVVDGAVAAIGEATAEGRALTSEWPPFVKAEEQPATASAMTTRKIAKENLVRMGTSLI